MALCSMVRVHGLDQQWRWLCLTPCALPRQEEHGLEMHFPFIVNVMKGREYTVVPIIVGSLSPQR